MASSPTSAGSDTAPGFGAESSANVERTVEMFARVLGLLRQLKARADAAQTSAGESESDNG